VTYQTRIYGLTDDPLLPLVMHTETLARAIGIVETTIPMRLAPSIYVTAEIWKCTGTVPTAIVHRATYYSPHA